MKCKDCGEEFQPEIVADKIQGKCPKCRKKMKYIEESHICKNWNLDW